ncbi:MAG: phosphoribosylaminoimidazolesuccinocarboxamide synthase [Actinomycetes bacterium]|nr:phosphoribosylaminoimidazolesuccinocarboxamide synthase [Actinomycetes bacterium]
MRTTVGVAEGFSSQGKVRDIYDLGDRLLLVATDRISAFDFVLPDLIPSKGEVLTRLSLFWFNLLADVVPNHFLSADTADLPAPFAADKDYLAGRFMLVKKAVVWPAECIVRGYLTGSGLADYQVTGMIGGAPLPEGLVEASRLESPVFTPSTKADAGFHDENISYVQLERLVGAEVAAELRDKSLAVYDAGVRWARQRGIIIADTKFEFGSVNGVLTLIDEVLTPDSSRFWPIDGYMPGQVQPSFDKQFVRNWLLSEESGWNRASGETPPPLPPDIIEKTSEKYRQAYEMITGEKF